jgi:hypothetical protein
MEWMLPWNWTVHQTERDRWQLHAGRLRVCKGDASGLYDGKYRFGGMGCCRVICLRAQLYLCVESGDGGG